MMTLYLSILGRVFSLANRDHPRIKPAGRTSPEHALDKRYAARRDQPDGAARRVALDVHGDRIHRDVRRGNLDVDAERGGAAAKSLRPDAELVHRLAQLRLD